MLLNEIHKKRGKDKKVIKKDGKETWEESEIDFIVEQDGVLYPIEIKQNDKVTADMTAAFKILDKIPEKKRGTGAIVCMCSAPGTLRENIFRYLTGLSNRKILE